MTVTSAAFPKMMFGTAPFVADGIFRDLTERNASYSGFRLCLISIMKRRGNCTFAADRKRTILSSQDAQWSFVTEPGC